MKTRIRRVRARIKTGTERGDVFNQNAAFLEGSFVFFD
jgi:hypothetical protein